MANKKTKTYVPNIEGFFNGNNKKTLQDIIKSSEYNHETVYFKMNDLHEIKRLSYGEKNETAGEHMQNGRTVRMSGGRSNKNCRGKRIKYKK